MKQALEKTQKRLISYNQKVDIDTMTSVCPVRSLYHSLIIGQAALTSVEYEDHIRNEAEIKQKVGKLEKDLKVNYK